MKKHFKLLLLAATVVVLLAMTMLVCSATAEIYDADGAKLGDSYSTLADAVAALPEVDGAATIKLTSNETLSEGIIIAHSITLDGNGYTLTAGSSVGTQAVRAEGEGNKVTLLNIKINAPELKL